MMSLQDIIRICDDAPAPREAIGSGPGSLDGWQSRLDDYDERMSRIREIADNLQEACGELEEYFESRADAEYHPGSPVPTGNLEMHLLSLVRSMGVPDQ